MTATIITVTNAIGIAMSETTIPTKAFIILLVVLVSILSALIALLVYYSSSYYVWLSNYAFMVIITDITITSGVPICKYHHPH